MYTRLERTIALLTLASVFGAGVALLAPVVAQARVSAGSDVGRLHDLGMAVRLYQQDYDASPATASVAPTSVAIDRPEALQPYSSNHGGARYAAAFASASSNCVATDPSGNWLSAEGGCKDSSTHLVWSASASVLTGLGVTFPDAQGFCANLNTTTGYSGWALPSLTQSHAAYINGGSGYINVARQPHWTGTTFRSKGVDYDRGHDWATGGEVDIQIKGKTTYSHSDAVCVRPGT
jgi:hypothetical protein